MAYITNRMIRISVILLLLLLPLLRLVFVGLRSRSSIVADTPDPDPYRVLGLSHTASLEEVKRKYKKLALEWHPDKNDDPKALQMFINIAKSYQIIRDKKRSQYDEQQHDQQEGFNSGFNFDGDRSGGSPGGGGRPSSNFETITYEIFHSTVLPESHKKAYMLLLTTRQLCPACDHVEKILKKNAQRLKDDGIGIGIVYSDYDDRFLRYLGLHDIGINNWRDYLPTIVGILDGQIDYFEKIVNTKNLRTFAMEMFPTTHIEKVNDDNFKSFLAGYSDNRPRMLLLSREPNPSLLHLTTALEFRDIMAFGFASLTSEVNVICTQYGVTDTPHLLVFKEADHYADSLKGSMLERFSMRHVIIDNQYLYAHRLSSQAVFDDLCPVSPSKETRKVCVILFTQRGKNHDEFRRTFSQVAVDTSLFPDVSRFMYVHEETQTVFTRNMGAEFREEMTLPVAVVWRRTRNTLDFDWLPGGWKKNDKDDNQMRLRDYLVELSNDVVTLSQTRQLDMLRDENEPHWLQLWISSMWERLSHIDIGQWLEENEMVILESYLLLLVAIITVVIMMGNVRSRNQPIHLSLDPESNERLILRARPGQMFLLILVDRTNMIELCFEAYRVKRLQSWKVLYLRVDRYCSWYEQLTNQAPGTQDLNKIIGNILAINGHDMYYCWYKGPQIDSYRASRRNIYNFYASLSKWIDRLPHELENRIPVTEWPKF